MLGRVLAFAVLFATPLVNTRVLSKTAYGYYRQFWLLFETITPILILGFPRSLLYFLPRAETRQEKSVYVTQTVAFLSVLSLLSVAAYGVMAHTLGGGMGAVARAFFWRLSAFTVLVMITQYMETLFVAERQVGRQAAFRVLVTVAQAVAVILTAWMTHDVSKMIWALTIYALVRFVFSLGYTASAYHLSPRHISLSSMAEQLSFALPVGLFSIALVLLGQTDKFVISRFMGREAFAVYAVGAYQVPFANIVAQSVAGVTIPLMAALHKRGEIGSIAELWQRAVVKQAVLFFPMLVILEIVARPMIRILFTVKYAEAAPVFMIYVLLLLRTTVDCIGILQVFKKTTYLVVAFSIAFVVNVVLSVVMFHGMGRLGVPLATIITMTLVNVSNIAYAARLVDVPIRRFVPFGALAARLMVAAAPGVAVWAVVRRISVQTPAALAVVGIVYGVMYLALCSWTGFLTLRDVKQIVWPAPAEERGNEE